MLQPVLKPKQPKVEDHNILNGLGSAVSDIAAGMGKEYACRTSVSPGSLE
jgi:transketolase C-terminal domain/subunit